MQNTDPINYHISYQEINEDSHHNFPVQHYAMFIQDDESCSCLLIDFKADRKDTSYCEDRGQVSEEKVEEGRLVEENPEDYGVQENIQKVRDARIEQQGRIGSYLVQLTQEIQLQKKGVLVENQIKSSKVKLIKKSRK